jgi:hypothetical protein
MRADNLRVERAAVAATELSLARCAELFMAVPVVDHGVDLMAYQADPFRVAKIQVKGATHDLKVFRQYSLTPMIVSYVLDPLGAASDHHPDNNHYHWKKRPTLLSLMLRDHLATPERWLELFDRTATPPPC